MKIKLTYCGPDGIVGEDPNTSEEAEVLVINGGAESVAGVLSEANPEIVVEVGAPQAVVIRETIGS